VPHHVSLLTAQCRVDLFFNREQLWPNPHLSDQQRVPGQPAREEAALFDHVARAYCLRDGVSCRHWQKPCPHCSAHARRGRPSGKTAWLPRQQEEAPAASPIRDLTRRKSSSAFRVPPVEPRAGPRAAFLRQQREHARFWWYGFGSLSRVRSDSQRGRQQLRFYIDVSLQPLTIMRASQSLFSSLIAISFSFPASLQTTLRICELPDAGSAKNMRASTSPNLARRAGMQNEVT